MSNVNYDPVKAHEYYEKHKKLKGRRSTKGFSDTQKEQWSYAKEQLKQEHKANNEAIAENKKERLEAISEEVSDKKEALTDEAQSKIESLREQMKNLPKAQKKAMRAKIQDAIGKIKDTLSAQKGQLGAAGAQAKELTKADASAAKEAEKASYEKKLDDAHSHIKGGGK